MYSVSLSDFRHMSPSERDRELTELVSRARAPRNGQASVLAAKIRSFEERYEISSEKLVEELKSGRRQETADISRWLFWLKAASDER